MNHVESPLGENFFPKPKLVGPSSAEDWPRPMAPEAFVGLPGDFVRLVEPCTEADPCGLLANFLVASGVLFGREAYAVADGKKHFPVESLLACGATGSGRKGTASTRVFSVMERVDPFLLDSYVLGGLSTGEGLIQALADKRKESPQAADRFLVMLPEFASLLSVMRREGNTLSAIIRQAWDGGRLEVRTRKEPLSIDNVNVSMIAHVTPEELLNSLTATDKANGFANRFLIVCVRRSKLLPEGGGKINPDVIVTRLRAAMDAAQGRGLFERDAAARELWADEYPRLTSSRDGIKGALCGRAEAHVLRVSLLYALLDSSDRIRPEHLRAAIAFWEYCVRSIEHVFGAGSGDPDAEKVLGALAGGPKTATDLHRVFSNHRDPEWILAKMAKLVQTGRVVSVVIDGSAKKQIQGWELKR
jgi:hypothetical protein